LFHRIYGLLNANDKLPLEAWRAIGQRLNIPKENLDALQNDISNFHFSKKVVYLELLWIWRLDKIEKATLSVLIDVLVAEDLKSCAGLFINLLWNLQFLPSLITILYLQKG